MQFDMPFCVDTSGSCVDHPHRRKIKKKTRNYRSISPNENLRREKVFSDSLR